MCFTSHRILTSHASPFLTTKMMAISLCLWHEPCVVKIWTLQQYSTSCWAWPVTGLRLAFAKLVRFLSLIETPWQVFSHYDWHHDTAMNSHSVSERLLRFGNSAFSKNSAFCLDYNHQTRQRFVTFSSVLSLSSTKWYSAPWCLSCNIWRTSVFGFPDSACEKMRSVGIGISAFLSSVSVNLAYNATKELTKTVAWIITYPVEVTDVLQLIQSRRCL